MVGADEPAVLALYRDGVVRAADGREFPIHPTSMLRSEGQALHQMIVDRRLSRTLEVGMAFGISTLWICDAVRHVGGGRHIAIDPWQDKSYKSIGRRLVAEAGFADMVTVHVEPSHVRLPRLVEDGVELDLAFIDGMHLFDFGLVDFFYVDHLLRTGGIVVFHDMWMPGLRKVVSFIRRNRDYRLVPLNTVGALTVPRRLYKSLARLRHPTVGRDHAGLRFVLGAENMCALEKIADDDRHHRHYRSF